MSLLVDGHHVSTLGVLALGVVVGWVAGMFGVGGGFLLTPLLHILFRVPLPIAVGSGLCQMVGTSLVAMLRHRDLGQGSVRFDLVMIGGTLLGVDAGARLLEAAGRYSLIINALWTAMLVGIAALFWFGAGARAGERVHPGPLARVRLGPTIDLPDVPLRAVAVLPIAWLGLLLGTLSGLLGIGGGVALMPVLTQGYGFPLRAAAGTGILVLFVTAGMGTLAHAARGNVHLPLAVTLLVGSTISAQLGALATRRWSSARLRRWFAAVVLATVAALAWDLVRRVGFPT